MGFPNALIAQPPALYALPSNYRRAAAVPVSKQVAVPGRANVVGTADITAAGLYGGAGALAGKTLILTVNGVLQTINWVGAGNASTEAVMLATIMATWPNVLQAFQQFGSNKLVLRDLSPGGTIVIGAGTSNANLGLTPGTIKANASGKLVPIRVGLMAGAAAWDGNY